MYSFDLEIEDVFLLEMGILSGRDWGRKGIEDRLGGGEWERRIVKEDGRGRRTEEEEIGRRIGIEEYRKGRGRDRLERKGGWEEGLNCKGKGREDKEEEGKMEGRREEQNKRRV